MKKRRKWQIKMRNMPLLKMIISGGGTGGHIFPAIAIANAVKEKIKDVEILFVGAEGRMEMEKVPAAGYKIIGLKISGFQRSFTLKNLSFPIKVVLSFIKARNIISNFKPDVVVGVGGYASGPTLKAAIAKKIPSLIQEQNSFPGITNKILSKKVDKICVAYQGMEKWFPKEKVVITGNPVRQEIVNLEGKKPRALEFFQMSNQFPTLLVIGGSLGAKTINESIAGALPIFDQKNIQVIWQTGKTYFKTAEALLQQNNYKNVRVFDFVYKMDLAYTLADLVVSRAGAISVSELCLVKKPCILIPSPNVAEDHQTRNAMALVNHNAAILIRDIDAREKLSEQVIELINNKEKLEKLSRNISNMGVENSAEAIANEIIRLVK
jgi:UDP-N-acetylglucosamine--N-acetylmuramyl-(pentapeptide) pyrophosphoryl-undecaprenol N-acetylglucosamine transferase